MTKQKVLSWLLCLVNSSVYSHALFTIITLNLGKQKIKLLCHTISSNPFLFFFPSCLLSIVHKWIKMFFSSYAIKHTKFLHSSFGYIIRNILSFTSYLQSVYFSHTCRQGNGLVDVLAKRAKFYSSLTAWIEFVVLDFYNCYLSDLKFNRIKWSHWLVSKKKVALP